MGQNTKALRLRIKSVSSTLQLTKAMELVASSKIRRANEAMNQVREYEKSLVNAIAPFCANVDVSTEMYFRVSNEPRTRLIVIAGDRGLAGGYNANVFRLVQEYADCPIIAIGKRASDRFGGELVSSELFKFETARRFAEKLVEDFLHEEYDRLGIVFTKYRSVISQDATLRWVLPLEASARPELAGALFEPTLEGVMKDAVCEYVAGMIFYAVKESFASEVAARRMAMDSAGKNAKEMIDDLQLQYNRARQGAITQEITEIVAGSGNE